VARALIDRSIREPLGGRCSTMFLVRGVVWIRRRSESVTAKMLEAAPSEREERASSACAPLSRREPQKVVLGKCCGGRRRVLIMDIQPEASTVASKAGSTGLLLRLCPSRGSRPMISRAAQRCSGLRTGFCCHACRPARPFSITASDAREYHHASRRAVPGECGRERCAAAYLARSASLLLRNTVLAPPAVVKILRVHPRVE